MDYKFTSEKFAISEKGFHLLRNEFNYKSFEISQLSDVWIIRGFDLRNWLFVLCIGILLIGYAIYDAINILFIINNPEGVIYIERLLIPLFPMALGLYSLRISLRKASVMIAKLDGKKFYFSLRLLDKKSMTNELIEYLKDIDITLKSDL